MSWETEAKTINAWCCSKNCSTSKLSMFASSAAWCLLGVIGVELPQGCVFWFLEPVSERPTSMSHVLSVFGLYKFSVSGLMCCVCVYCSHLAPMCALLNSGLPKHPSPLVPIRAIRAPGTRLLQLLEVPHIPAISILLASKLLLDLRPGPPGKHGSTGGHEREANRCGEVRSWTLGKERLLHAAAFIGSVFRHEVIDIFIVL